MFEEGEFTPRERVIPFQEISLEEGELKTSETKNGEECHCRK